MNLYCYFFKQSFKIKRKSNQKNDNENDPKYKLTLAFQNLNEINQKMLPESRENVYVIDLTENNLNGSNDLRFLLEFPNLNTLILDKNLIQSNIRLPLMEKLSTLWVNHNKIDNLSVFIQNITETCPNLKYLSMINNKAAPSYFNGGSLIEYNDYRLYVISKLKNLTLLDDKEVTPEERTQSLSLYGKTRSTTIRKNSSIHENKKKNSKNQQNPITTKKLYDQKPSQKIQQLPEQDECFNILPEILNMENEQKNESINLEKEEPDHSTLTPLLQELESLPELPSLNSSIELLEIPDLPQISN